MATLTVLPPAPLSHFWWLSTKGKIQSKQLIDEGLYKTFPQIFYIIPSSQPSLSPQYTLTTPCNYSGRSLCYHYPCQPKSCFSTISLTFIGSPQTEQPIRFSPSQDFTASLFIWHQICANLFPNSFSLYKSAYLRLLAGLCLNTEQPEHSRCLIIEYHN